MPSYHVWTIGCQMNRAESERLSSCFEELGYRAAATATGADLVVLNSCVVRQSAENRITNKLHNLRQLKKDRPDLVIAVTGCLVDAEVDRLKKSFPYVDYFFKPGDYPPWVENDITTPPLPRYTSPSAYVPIIQGCDNFCTYCIVPYRRGRERSRPMPDIICEARELVRLGIKAVTLLGQNVDSYGHDLPDKPELADLLIGLNRLSGLARIRFLTNHPKDMSPRLIKTIAKLDKVCEQISLPVQSGNNEILEAMRRGYTEEQYRQLVAEIRSQIPGVALSTDVIVGFPSESASQFQQTLDLLAEIKFDTVHVAAYSPRAGTTATRDFTDNVPLPEKKARLGKVERLQEKIAAETNARLLGETQEILVESRTKGKWYGRTRTDKLVFFHNGNDCLGQLVNIRIEKTSPWALQGKIIANTSGKEGTKC
ncbi:MAG: tRNA (N6-isopentenyl adenosine(37)-C2)-methylthiotransferase MiaB [Chloroflexi bacterium RBG_16_50_9]|nr:MAG: tRNA (N6-isopentenyl adenosine(37)-C2)-methylthiotransferase MiaB [Chloroflexi bacterium RBG_16_50_9]